MIFRYGVLLVDFRRCVAIAPLRLGSISLSRKIVYLAIESHSSDSDERKKKKLTLPTWYPPLPAEPKDLLQLFATSRGPSPHPVVNSSNWSRERPIRLFSCCISLLALCVFGGLSRRISGVGSVLACIGIKEG